MSFRNTLPGVPPIESTFFDLVAEESRFDGDLVRIANDLRRDGLAVLDFPDDQIEQRSERIKTALHDTVSDPEFPGWDTAALWCDPLDTGTLHVGCLASLGGYR